MNGIWIGCYFNYLRTYLWRRGLFAGVVSGVLGGYIGGRGKNGSGYGIIG